MWVRCYKCQEYTNACTRTFINVRVAIIPFHLNSTALNLLSKFKIKRIPTVDCIL